MRDATERDLVTASRGGDRDAFAELVRRCAAMIDAVAYAATRDRALADDIAQDTFVTAWQDLARLRDTDALRPWLCRIARNLAHKARRRRRHDAVDANSIAVDRTPFDAVREREVERLVDDALARVPAPYREALVLFYFEEKSTKAVATALGVTEAVVHQRLSRGRRHLAATFERHVETSLGRRRSRRDLAAAVLAALALMPRSAHASPRGVTVMKLSGVTIAAASVALTALTLWPTADAAPRKRVTPPKPAATHAAAAPRISIPARPSSNASAACKKAVRHIMDVSLEALEGPADAHPDGVQRVTHELEERCRKEAWSERQTTCLVAAEYPRDLAKCVPAPRAQPVEGPPAPVDADVDISCKSVGAHMADLMIESASLDNLENVAANVLEDFDELPAQAIESCSNYEWSEDLRRCYAASDRYAQTVACNLRWR